MFITFEGIEGCGKSTQCRSLALLLEKGGKTVLPTREPGGSALGLELRKILLDIKNKDLTSHAELFLYLADRAQHVATLIQPALNKGNVVISDRYADSTIVYQGYGRGLDVAAIHAANNLAVGGLWPHLTILIDLPVDLGLDRALARNLKKKKNVQEGRFEAENITFHNKIRQGYLSWASLHTDRFAIVDGLGAPDEVFSRVETTVRQRLPNLFMGEAR